MWRTGSTNTTQIPVQLITNTTKMLFHVLGEAVNGLDCDARIFFRHGHQNRCNHLLVRTYIAWGDGRMKGSKDRRVKYRNITRKDTLESVNAQRGSIGYTRISRVAIFTSLYTIHIYKLKDTHTYKKPQTIFRNHKNKISFLPSSTKRSTCSPNSSHFSRMRWLSLIKAHIVSTAMSCQ